MKKIVFALSLILIFVGGFAQKKVNCIKLTKKVAVCLEKKQYDEIRKLFDPSLKETVSVSQLGQIWESVCKKGGGFIAFGVVTETKYNSHPVGHALCKLKNGNQNLIVNLNSAGEISGLFFQPADSK